MMQKNKAEKGKKQSAAADSNRQELSDRKN